MEAFKWIWEYLRHYKARIIAGLILMLVVSGVNMIPPRLSGLIVDRVIYGKQAHLLAWIIAGFIAITLLKTVVRYISQMIFEVISQNIVFDVRKGIYTKVQEQDFRFFDSTRTGDIMARMTGDLEAVRHFTAFVFASIVENLSLFLFAVIMLFTIDVKLTLIMFAVTPFIGVFAYKMASSVKPAFSAIREQFSRLNTVVQENISGNRVVKAFAKEAYEIQKFEKENEDFREKNLAASKVWEKYLPALDSLAGSLIVVMILVGGVMVIRGKLSMGELVVFNGLIWALNNPMRMSGWLINDVQRFAASSDKIMAILNSEPGIQNDMQSISPEEIKGEVEFRNVSFSYGDEKVLDDISFVAKPGQKTAFIGPTGSGKSTLISLIARFYDCTSGEVLIDGKNIKKYDLNKLRSSVAAAMQDIFLFSDTIEGNIAYGVPDAPMEQVEYMSEIARAQFIKDFPEGYDTIIGERGVGLSGGQKQRIALARALMKNSPILVLDDTTSSLDIETEHEVQSALRVFSKSKTVFVIAHRISSVKDADMIIVLDKGRIVERGSHDELLALKGAYFKICLNQLGDLEQSLKEGA